MPPHIRRAVATDAGEIARLTTELGYPASTADIAARLDELLASRSHFIAVAELASNLAGWVAAERRMLLESGERFEIIGLIVSRDMRRAGVGKALVRTAEDWARATGAEVIHVRSNVTRIESHPFYERLGYFRRKTQHAYAKELRRTDAAD